MLEKLQKSTEPQDGTVVIFRTIALAALTAVAIYACWLMTAPFLSAFTWAFAFTVAFFPLHRWLSARMPKLVATLLVIVIVVLAISIPGAFLLRELFQESVRAQELLQASFQSESWRKAVADRPWIESILNWANQQLDLSEIGQQITATMARSIAPAVARSASVISELGVIFLAFFFFLQDKEVTLNGVRRLLPFSQDEVDHLFARVSETVQATVYGRLLIGTIQGCLGGVIFAVVGLPGAVLWGAVMIVLSLLPVFGAFLVWIPASVFLLLQGHWIQALIVAIGGLVLIHPVDNLLYPTLVGSRIGLHPLILFIAFVGGLIVLGPAGLILGPCIVAVAIALAEIWQSRSAGVALVLHA